MVFEVIKQCNKSNLGTNFEVESRSFNDFRKTKHTNGTKYYFWKQQAIPITTHIFNRVVLGTKWVEGVECVCVCLSNNLR